MYGVWDDVDNVGDNDADDGNWWPIMAMAMADVIVWMETKHYCMAAVVDYTLWFDTFDTFAVDSSYMDLLMC